MNTQSKHRFLGNNLAIDFINTEYVEQGAVVDNLQSLNDVCQWASEAGLETQKFSKNDSICKVYKLRTSLKELFITAADGKSLPDKALKTVNQFLQYRSEITQIEKVEDRVCVVQKQKKMSLDRLLGAIAYEAALLLTSSRIHQLKHCSNPKCALLFLDTSKSKRRRWCSMDVCGNRAKAANYYVSAKNA